MTRLSARLARIERHRHAALAALRPHVCRFCAGVDPVAGRGPIRGYTRLTGHGENNENILCRMCPKAWRGRVEDSPNGWPVIVGVPTENPL